MKSELKKFLEEWKEVRGKTLEFLESVPEDKMNWRPHELLGTFGMQMRHIGKSQEAYINGIESGKVDFEDKSFDPDIEMNKDKALKRLRELDKKLIKLVEGINDVDKEIAYVDGVYGEHKVSLVVALGYLLDHEFYHQGIFTCYGRLAGLGKFTFI